MPPTPHENSTSDIDLDLLRKAAAGDGAAFHELVDRHAQRLYRLAVMLVGNAADAEDVLQEAFVGAYRAAGKFEARSSVKTWLTKILITQAARCRRDRKRRGVTEPLETASILTAGESVAAARIDIDRAIAQLSTDHREVLLLREFEQMSYDEIAAALGVPRGTVESRLHRARAELRERLKAYLP